MALSSKKFSLLKFGATSIAVLIASAEVVVVSSSPCGAVEHTAPNSTLSKAISRKELEKYKSISVTVEEDGKQVKYEGVPLRTLLAELLPKYDLDSMPDVKKMARLECVMEVLGYDNYPGIVTVLEVAMNHAGDRYLLATHKDGKEIDPGVQLICKLDEMHTRWVHHVVRLNIHGLKFLRGATQQSTKVIINPAGDFGSNHKTFVPGKGLESSRN